MNENIPSNEGDLSNRPKGTHGVAMTRIRLKNICKRWVEYNVDKFHIALNSKRKTKHSFEYVKTVKINSLLTGYNNNVYHKHENKESIIYKMYPSLNIAEYNNLINNKRISQGIVSILVQRYSTMQVSSITFSARLLKPTVKLFREFEFEENYDYEKLAKHVNDYNYRYKINKKNLNIHFKTCLFIIHYFHQNKQDLFLVRFHNNTLFIESKCLHTSESRNVCRSIVYFLYTTTKFDPNKVNLKVCNNNVLYKQQEPMLIHLNVIFVLQLISIYYDAIIKNITQSEVLQGLDKIKYLLTNEIQHSVNREKTYEYIFSDIDTSECGKLNSKMFTKEMKKIEH